MLLVGAYKPQAFLSIVERHISPSEHKGISWWATAVQKIFEQIRDNHWVDVDPETRIVYLGAGYWRARLHFDMRLHRLGAISLMNPDLDPEQIRRVEAGLGVLCHCGHSMRTPEEHGFSA